MNGLKFNDGGGKYDKESESILIETKASGVVLVVVGGSKGHGVSVSFDLAVMRSVVPILANVLRQVAANLERECAEAAHRHESEN